MSQRVSFSLIYDFCNPAREQWTRRYDAILEQIEWVDREMPIDGVRITEHHFHDDGYMPSPLLMAGVLAARTKRVTIGTNVAQLPLHQPVRFAEEALVVDALSGGRLFVGLGMGYYEQEFAGVGTTARHRVSRMEEGLDILRLAFAGEPFAYEGKRFSTPEIEVTPLPVRPGGPPMWIGASAPAAIERAARKGDGFLALFPESLDQYFAACERIGRPEPQRSANFTYSVIIAEDPEKAFDEMGHNWLIQINNHIARGWPEGHEVFDDPRDALDAGLTQILDADGAIRLFNDVIAKGAIDLTIIPIMPGEDVDGASERVRYVCDHVLPHLDRTDHPAAGALQRPTPAEFGALQPE